MLETLSTIFEIIMVLGFGASWPFNIVKAYKAKTTKGTSLLFMSLIGFGYVAGILSKVFKWMADASAITPLSIVAFVFYFINLGMIVTGVIIYFRNKHYDAERAASTCSDCTVHN